MLFESLAGRVEEFRMVGFVGPEFGKAWQRRGREVDRWHAARRWIADEDEV